MAVRQFTILALVFFAVVGMAFAASDAPTPSTTSKAPTATEGEGAAGAATEGAPTAADAASAGGSPTEGPGSGSDASTFKGSIVGAFIVNLVTATLFIC